MEEDDLSNLSDEDEDDEHDDAQHVADLKALALKDPEFFKYLQENDQELLDCGGDDDSIGEDDEDEEMAGPDDDDEDDEDSEDEGASKKSKKGKGKAKAEVVVKKTPVLTKEILKTWQTSLLKVHLTSIPLTSIARRLTPVPLPRRPDRFERYESYSSLLRRQLRLEGQEPPRVERSDGRFNPRLACYSIFSWIGRA